MLDSEVVSQLRKMAKLEDSRISQIAAIIALRTHDAVDVQSQGALDQLRSDENWSAIIQELVQ